MVKSKSAKILWNPTFESLVGKLEIELQPQKTLNYVNIINGKELAKFDFFTKILVYYYTLGKKKFKLE
jgi:hypothetical protein